MGSQASSTPPDRLNPVQLISLDMTVLEDSGRWYYLWQQVGSVWIAPFDPRRPARLTGQPAQLIVPEFAWDNLIAEGPNAIVHDGVIYLIYSGSSVGIDQPVPFHAIEARHEQNGQAAIDHMQLRSPEAAGHCAPFGVEVAARQ